MLRWLLFHCPVIVPLVVVDSVSAPRAQSQSQSQSNSNTSSTVFESTKGLLLAELEERESEVNLLRKALSDLSGGKEDYSRFPESKEKADASISMHESTDGEVPLARPRQPTAAAALTEQAAGQGASRLMRRQDQQRQEASSGDQAFNLQDVMKTGKDLSALSESWSLASKAASGAASAAAEEAQSEAATARAARRAQQGLTSIVQNMEMDHKGKVRALLQATKQVSELRENELRKAEQLASELREARDHEAKLATGLKLTLDKEASVLENIGEQHDAAH